MIARFESEGNTVPAWPGPGDLAWEDPDQVRRPGPLRMAGPSQFASLRPFLIRTYVGWGSFFHHSREEGHGFGLTPVPRHERHPARAGLLRMARPSRFASLLPFLTSIYVGWGSFFHRPVEEGRGVGSTSVPLHEWRQPRGGLLRMARPSQIASLPPFLTSSYVGWGSFFHRSVRRVAGSVRPQSADPGSSPRNGMSALRTGPSQRR